MNNNFIKFISKMIKSKYGNKYRQVMSDVFFEAQKQNMRGIKPRKSLITIMVEKGMFTLDEFKHNPRYKPKVMSEFEKIYHKYYDLVQYFVFRYARIVKNKAAVHEEDIIQESWLQIWRKINFTWNHHGIVSYISKVVRHTCLRMAARAVQIRIPDHAYRTVLDANIRPNDCWETLLKPRNRFVKYLEDIDTSNLRQESPENNEDPYSHLKVSLYDIIASLTQKQRIIIIMRYGLYGFEEHSLEEIGKLFKCSRERVRQIEEIILRSARLKLLSDSDVTLSEKATLRKLPTATSYFKTSTFRKYVHSHHVNMVG